MIKFLEINLNHPAHYIGVGPFSVSVGNLTIIIAMMVIFTIALFAPFPNHEHRTGTQEMHSSNKGDEQ